MGVIELKKTITCIVLIGIIFSMFSGRVLADDCIEDEAMTDVLVEESQPVTKGKLPVIDAHAAIVIEFESGRVLYEKNAYSKRAMASTTKIMTAIVALENSNLNDIVTVSPRAARIGGSLMHLTSGEKLTMLELLYGLLLRSGNDAAIAIAEHVGGSVENFADMMNKKAREIGANNTHFVTPHGLDAPDHYTTAYDLALMTQYALKNPVFAKIVATKEITIGKRTMYNTNEMLNIYQGADGVKTGYTGQAGRCLVTSAKRGNMRLISVVLNCPTRSKRALSSKKILDYAYENYKYYNLLKADDKFNSIPVIKGVKSEVDIIPSSEIGMPLSHDEAKSIEKIVELPKNLKAPVAAGTEVGTVKFVIKDKVIAETSLKTAYDVRKMKFGDYMYKIIENWGEILHIGNKNE